MGSGAPAPAAGVPPRRGRRPHRCAGGPRGVGGVSRPTGGPHPRALARPPAPPPASPTRASRAPNRDARGDWGDRNRALPVRHGQSRRLPGTAEVRVHIRALPHAPPSRCGRGGSRRRGGPPPSPPEHRFRSSPPKGTAPDDTTADTSSPLICDRGQQSQQSGPPKGVYLSFIPLGFRGPTS